MTPSETLAQYIEQVLASFKPATIRYSTPRIGIYVEGVYYSKLASEVLKKIDAKRLPGKLNYWYRGGERSCHVCRGTGWIGRDNEERLEVTECKVCESTGTIELDAYIQSLESLPDVTRNQKIRELMDYMGSEE